MNENQSRLVAFYILQGIILNEKTLMNAYNHFDLYDRLGDSDKQFCRLLVLTVLRRWGQLQSFLQPFLSKPLPKKRQDILIILCMGIAQIYYLKTPIYASVDTSVQLTRLIKQSSFSRLINGVLRSFIRKMDDISEPDVLHNLPKWLFDAWQKTYTLDEIRIFATAFLQEAPLDITAKSHPEQWADKWQGEVLTTNTIRCAFQGNVALMEGYEAGEWWVQEASASIPAQLFPDLVGKKVADLCAAPGGKTAQMAVRGANVDAYDISENRLKRLDENMKRLNLEQNVQTVCQDVLLLKDTEKYDAVLLDAPCSATGTIRRHPDLYFHRTQADVIRLSRMQKKLLEQAIRLTKPNGYIVYSTCSMQAEENEDVVRDILQKMPNLKRVTLSKKWQKYCNAQGAIQITPAFKQDGFYAVLLQKTVA